MKAMLKPGGVLAICIDDNELFHLGMMMDEVFGEENRIAIINWQKSYSPKNDSKHVSTATEYVLVYARDKERAKTGLLSREEGMNAKYRNPDNDPYDIWRSSDATVATPSEKDRYAIQSPFTGALHYPGSRAWSNRKSDITLSDQQTELLLQLEPDALIAASATMRIPDKLNKRLNRLRDDKGWNDSDFITYVKSSDVVNSGLIKKHISLGGYVTTMEIAIDEMLVMMGKVTKAASDIGLTFTPKAIYVSNTNLVAGTSEKGDFKHIIFNLTLQEGWDDPACYFAYIDKDMGSKDQVTQVIGRVLRQPDARHYPFNALNTAHFYIRTDDKSVFKEILNVVNDKITSEMPDITITFHKGGSGNGEKPMIAPRKQKMVPEVNIDSRHAADPVRKVVELIEDYRTDNVNTVGKGGRVQVFQTIGSGKAVKEEWVEIEHSNRVPARWIFIREVERFYGDAVNLCDIEDPKFDAMVEYTSRAAENIRDAARKVVNAYTEHSMIVQDSISSYSVDEIPVNTSDLVKFKYSVHPGYSKSSFNKFELKFAEALDKAKKDWMRNPSKSFFDIPLLDGGNTKNFNPDFLVWVTNAIIAIDTKGDHLIHVDSARKLFHIKKIRKGPELLIRLVTEGQWNIDKNKIGSNGYTVWKLKDSRPTPFWCSDINEAVQVCLRTDDVK